MNDGPTKRDCSTLFKCFLFSVGYGLRYQNGVSDQMKHTLGRRYPLDVLYFLIVLIVLLNVVFGIIIDTFGNLRNKKIQRLIDTTEKCFICGISKQVFDRSSVVPNGFKIHITTDHNMWNYLYFIIYIWEQDKDDDDGLEQYVRKSLELGDISWFPMNKALRLTVTNTAEDELRIQLNSDIEGIEKNLFTKIQTFQNHLNESIDKISFHLKKHNNSFDLIGLNDIPLIEVDPLNKNVNNGNINNNNPHSNVSSRKQSTRITPSLKPSRVSSATNERK